jgi:hypothetical protein
MLRKKRHNARHLRHITETSWRKEGQETQLFILRIHPETSTVFGE